MRAAIPLLVALLVAACTEKGPYYGNVKPKHPPTELWINNSSEPEWIDPSKCSEGNGSTIIFQLFAGLTQPHPVTLDPMPDIARRWDIEDGGKTYIFHLRESLWSDGTPLTAHDFVWSWKRTLDPKTASKYASFLYPFKYAEPFNSRALVVKPLAPEVTLEELQAAAAGHGEVTKVQLAPDLGAGFIYPTIALGDSVEAAKQKRQGFIDGLQQIGGSDVSVALADRDLVAVTAVDDLTIKVELEQPLPFVLHIMKFYTAMPVPRHVIEGLEKQGKHTDLWTRPEYIVSNGAYKLTGWKFRQEMILEKNERYWDAQNVRTPKIKLMMVPSYNTTLDIYKAGYMDWVGENGSLPSEFMDVLQNYDDFNRDKNLAVYFYWINTKKPPLDNPLVRKALSLSVDRESIVKYVTRAGQIPTSDIVPDGLSGYRALKSEIFNPEKAKALLAEAGFPNGEGFPETTLVYNTSEGHKKIAESVQQMWKKHLGLSINLHNQEWNIFQKRLAERDFQIARMGWVGDYPDPYTFLELFTAANGNNRSGWADLRYEELLSDANAKLDPKERMETMREAELLLKDAAPIIPFYVYTRSQMWKPYLMGLWPNFEDRHPFKYMWIDERWYDGVPEARLPNPPPEMRYPEPAPEEDT